MNGLPRTGPELAHELVQLDEDIQVLEDRLSRMKADRDDLMHTLDRDLVQMQKRSIDLKDGTKVTISKERVYKCAKGDGVRWALKHGHTAVLTVKEREFSSLLKKIAKESGQKPDGVEWISYWDKLKLTVKRA